MLKIIPSLVINALFDCNLKCVYCPPYGENLIVSDILCNIESICYLVKAAKESHIEMVRITGGEPLTDRYRTEPIMEASTRLNFNRLILNTNGVFLNDSIDWLSKYKNSFECKVSLDTLKKDEYIKITKSDKIERVIEGILNAKKEGFNVVINSVITIYNYKSINEVVDFCIKNDLDIKIFDMSDFGNTFKKRWKKYYWPVGDIITDFEKKFSRKPDERLYGGRGRPMASFIVNNTKILVIDHHSNANAIYSKRCLTCSNYPCVSGRLCVTLRADGLLSPCRMRPDLGECINGLGQSRIKNILLSQMKLFDDCHFA